MHVNISLCNNIKQRCHHKPHWYIGGSYSVFAVYVSAQIQNIIHIFPQNTLTGILTDIHSNHVSLSRFDIWDHYTITISLYTTIEQYCTLVMGLIVHL